MPKTEKSDAEHADRCPIFPDGPAPTGPRYRANSASSKLEKVKA